ncbi:MAG: MlaD family protein [Candidatus Dormibacteria bacterium]
MRSRFNIVIVLVYMLIAGSALTYMAAKMGGPCLLQQCTSLNVEFKDASGLLHSNDVRMAGVQVGQVTSIAVKKDLALVSMKLEARYLPVYRDAKAIVRPKNLLGETYVEIDRGTAPSGELKSGDTIPLAQTLTPVQVDELLNALDPTTRQKLTIVINALGEATARRGQDLNLGAADFRRITQDLQLTSTTLNTESGDIDALLVQLDKIQQTAADYHSQLAQVLQMWSDTSRTMLNHDQNFADAIGHLDGVLGSLDQGLTPATPALARAVATLPQTIDDTNTFLTTSSGLASLYLKPIGPNAKPVIADGIDLFPRLAQVMIGGYACDTHIYANYQNVPGQTEAAQCPASGTALTDRFGGSEQAKGDSSSGGNRHLWRVMGQFSAQDAQCGLSSPNSSPPSVCSPGTTGQEGYAAPKGGTPASSAKSLNLWQQLWADLTGAGNA